MSSTSRSSSPVSSAPLRGWRRVFASPTTRLGWWTVALAAAFVLLFAINLIVFTDKAWDAPVRHVLLPYYGITQLGCGLAAGITGLIALLRRGERSWLVALCVLPALFVTAFVLGEFFVPH